MRGKVAQPRRRLHRKADAKTEHKRELRRLLDAAGINGAVDVGEFRRYGSARKLYHFHIDNVGRILMTSQDRWIHTPPRKSATFDDYLARRNPPRRGDRHL